MFIVVNVTVPDEKTGEGIANEILKHRLAACANMVQGIRSFYWWDKKINDEKECMLIIKTKLSLYHLLEEKILELHPYKVPEIIALPIVTGSSSYLNWIAEETIPTEKDPGIRVGSF